MFYLKLLLLLKNHCVPLESNKGTLANETKDHTQLPWALKSRDLSFNPKWAI